MHLICKGKGQSPPNLGFRWKLRLGLEGIGELKSFGDSLVLEQNSMV